MHLHWHVKMDILKQLNKCSSNTGKAKPSYLWETCYEQTNDKIDITDDDNYIFNSVCEYKNIEVAKYLCQIEPSYHVVIEDNKIILTPAKPKYTLEELLKNVTPEMQHDELDWGEYVGEEIW